jgi:hypothetical protein
MHRTDDTVSLSRVGASPGQLADDIVQLRLTYNARVEGYIIVNIDASSYKTIRKMLEEAKRIQDTKRKKNALGNTFGGIVNPVVKFFCRGWRDCNTTTNLTVPIN